MTLSPEISPVNQASGNDPCDSSNENRTMAPAAAPMDEPGKKGKSRKAEKDGAEAPAAGNETASDGEPAKKKGPKPIQPSPELRFARSLIADKSIRIGGLTDNGSIDQSLYKWNGKHWELLNDAQKRKIALVWLAGAQKDRCSSRAAEQAVATAADLMIEQPDQALTTLEKARGKAAFIPVNNAYFKVHLDGKIQPLEPERVHGMTYTVPAEFDWSRVEKDGTYVPRPVDPESCFGKYLDRFMPDLCVRRLLQEAAAVSVLPINLETAFVLSGDGSNGKSTFLHLLRELHPANTALRLKGADGRFGFQNIAGKTLVIAAEVPDFIGKDAEQNLKSLISRDPIEVERKHQPSVCIVPRATLFLAINEALKFTDHTYGNERKYLTIPFLVRLPKDSKDRIADFHLLITKNPKEMAVVLDWILEGAARLLKQENRFSPLPESVAAYTQASKLTTDNVAGYLDDREVKFCADELVSKMDVFTDYQEFCHERGVKSVAAESFWTRVREIFQRLGHDLGQQFCGTDGKGRRVRAVNLSVAGIAPKRRGLTKE